jgi:hypothetical protein
MRLFLFFLFLVFCKISFSQTDVFETDGKGNRDIERGVRIPTSPKIVENITGKKVETRPLLDLKKNTIITTDTIEAATIEAEPLLTKLYPCYIKVGMGSALMPFAEFYANSTRSRTSNFGFRAQHQSFFGKIKTREKLTLAPAGFDKTSLLGNFHTFQKDYSFVGKLEYINHGFHYYGLPNANANADSLAQRYQTFDANFRLETHPLDTARFNTTTNVNYRYTTTAKPFVDSLQDWKAKEQAFKFNVKGYYRMDKHEFQGLLGLRYIGYAYGIEDSVLMGSDSGLIRKNPIFDINPGIKSSFLDNNLLMNVGFTVSIDGASTTKAYFFPAVYLQYGINENTIIPFITLSGQVHQNSLYNLYSINPFINPNIILRNEINPYDIQLGVKARIGNNIKGGFSANFIKVNNRAFFVTDTSLSSGNRFTLVYDSLNHTKIEANFSYQSGSKLNINAIARYNSYEMRHELKAWNLPNFEFILGGVYNLYDKLIVKADLHLGLNRFAKVYQPGPNVGTENNQYYYNLRGIIDGNLGVEYRYSKRLSGFIQINNVVAQRYLQFYNYPVMPIQVLAGITFKF